MNWRAVVIINSVKDLAALRKAEGLEHVEINMSELAAGGIASYAGKLGVWSLVENGTLTIKCPNVSLSPAIVPGTISFNLLCQTLFPAILPYASLVNIDRDRKNLIFRRTSSRVKSNKWSFGIIFSGSAVEFELLSNCIRSIRNQTIFEKDWEIVVCGPKASQNEVLSKLDVDYLSFETRSIHHRFDISSKKNYLMSKLKHSKKLICHTRIELKPSCIENLPLEFELITPSVTIDGSAGKLPYLDLGFIRGTTRNLNSVKITPCYYDRRNWISYLANAIPYIDGGLYCINSNWVKENNLCEHLAWAEAEDVEWCQRLNANGFICELSLSAKANSQTCKMDRYKQFGHLKLYRWLSHIKNLLQK